MVSVLPILVDDAVEITPNVWEFLNSINDAKLFRDLYFVIVPVSVLAMSSILDMWSKTRTAGSLSIMSFIFNIISLFIGLIGFMKMPHATHLASALVTSYSIGLGYALVVSFLSEVGVSIYHATN